ncbi:glycosyl hydrolase family 17 protein [Porticoccaceae bacterium]|jgi:exo-beta-1,3-glucanase (GH17 family)|nr:glycosyl hydrolase family 17 protein [Porticoccaceae bacterium]MDB2634128.1 glycosyl hydrolase family 17 protein [Porticoccaceae bacterium]MDB2664897.1 glycosyl hydrolase family 17 protein [Porticoccaceae bacterium]
MTKNKRLPYSKAICYSGYRDGQSPDGNNLPSYEQVKQDLLILKGEWTSLRLYASDAHSDTIMEVIRTEKLPFDVMLGAYITAEQNNPNCPWGGIYSEEQLADNKRENLRQIDRLIQMANEFDGIVSCVSIGNEAAVEWTDHLVSTEQLTKYAKMARLGVKQPVTFCENYVPWLNKLKPLAEQLDIISIHTYPVWEYKNIDEGLAYTIENYNAVAAQYPDKQVIITEAGWATKSNGRGIEPNNVNEVMQRQYLQELMAWAESQQILVYFFEAFDENWKGSDDPFEPEKHWGIYKADRSPKLAMKAQLSC